MQFPRGEIGRSDKASMVGKARNSGNTEKHGTNANKFGAKRYGWVQERLNNATNSN
jgi:hypothetical protein